MLFSFTMLLYSLATVLFSHMCKLLMLSCMCAFDRCTDNMPGGPAPLQSVCMIFKDEFKFRFFFLLFSFLVVFMVIFKVLFVETEISESLLYFSTKKKKLG